jgi:hypothetical protein
MSLNSLSHACPRLSHFQSEKIGLRDLHGPYSFENLIICPFLLHECESHMHRQKKNVKDFSSLRYCRLSETLVERINKCKVLWNRIKMTYTSLSLKLLSFALNSFLLLLLMISCSSHLLLINYCLLFALLLITCSRERMEHPFWSSVPCLLPRNIF